MHTPKQDGFSMPAEFAPHEGTVLIFPSRPGSWGTDPSAAQQAFAQIAARLSQCERVFMLVDDRTEAAAKALLPESVVRVHIPTDDAWARDVMPTFVRRADGTVRGISWQFNAWGGDFDGLYPDYAQDDAAADAFCAQQGFFCYNARPFVLEGGAIHTDGEGTLLVTEACLLSGGRNPQMTKDEISAYLCDFLGAKKVVWLPYGIYNDETNEHIDNAAAFTAPAELVLAWCDDPDDPQYAMCRADYDVLARETDAKGRRFRVVKLPVPHQPVCVTEAECAGYAFAPGEDTRTPGERLAASYVNFYFGNDCVLVPQFGGDYAADDAKALEILRRCIRGREVVPIPARCILLGGGNIHCITQQIPAGRTDAEICPLTPAEYPALRELLYEAIYIPAGSAPPEPEITDRPELALYWQDFGSRAGDFAVCAKAGGRLAGAAWARIMDDYGHLYDGVPSLACAVYPGWRGRGIGTAMLRALLDTLRAAGYTRVTLSVQKENPAVRLYRRLGFETAAETEAEYLMVYQNGK